MGVTAKYSSFSDTVHNSIFPPPLSLHSLQSSACGSGLNDEEESGNFLSDVQVDGSHLQMPAAYFLVIFTWSFDLARRRGDKQFYRQTILQTNKKVTSLSHISILKLFCHFRGKSIASEAGGGPVKNNTRIDFEIVFLAPSSPRNCLTFAFLSFSLSFSIFSTLFSALSLHLGLVSADPGKVRRPRVTRKPKGARYLSELNVK